MTISIFGLAVSEPFLIEFQFEFLAVRESVEETSSFTILPFDSLTQNLARTVSVKGLSFVLRRFC
jgi:hypothetical protein